ncbi:reverse transcriptase domain-containing protein [Tanacetum coccineum]
MVYGGRRRPFHRAQERHTPYVAPHRPNNDFRRARENKVILTLGSLISTPAEILATEHHLNLPQPAPLVGAPSKENIHKFCDYHNEKGHNTNDCFVLKKQLEAALETGKLNHLIKDVRQKGKKGQKQNGSRNAVINMIRNHDLDRKRKTAMTDEGWMNVPITFPPVPTRDLSDEALVMEAEIEGYLVKRIHIDEGASIEIMYEHCFNMLHLKIKARLAETQTTVSGFSGERVKPLGKIELDVCFGGAGRCRRAMMRFTVVPAPSPYNIILGRPALKQLRAIPSTIHGMMKFPTRWGIATVLSQAPTVLECRREEKKQAREKEKDPVKEIEPTESPSPTEFVLVNPAYPEQLVKIGKNLSTEGSTQLKNLLRKNKDVFAWEPADMTGVPKRIIKHSLNVNPADKPIAQKRRTFSEEKKQAITREVSEWLKAGIVRRVKYPTWISNPVLVQKPDGSWRMCIDFKNLNSSCPKDYYPLPEIESKIEAVMGYPLKCFLDAYKGYHQVQMADEDEEKTAFYTYQGTFFYKKMLFGLKNAGATYQRLVDEAFNKQIGRNLKVYVDDMVIKSKAEKDMLADIAETFDNLRRINMKLNPKKCSFGVEEGKFLGYMVTSEGIRANPAKIKDIAKMKSPRTWGRCKAWLGN